MVSDTKESLLKYYNEIQKIQKQCALLSPSSHKYLVLSRKYNTGKEAYKKRKAAYESQLAKQQGTPNTYLLLCKYLFVWYRFSFTCQVNTQGPFTTTIWWQSPKPITHQPTCKGTTKGGTCKDGVTIRASGVSPLRIDQPTGSEHQWTHWTAKDIHCP